MRAFIKIKKHDLHDDYQQLAQRIWEIKTPDPWVNHLGANEALNALSDFGFGIMPSDLNKEWNKVKVHWNAALIYIHETHNKNVVVVYSEFTPELPFNQKAFYNLVAHLAEALDGVISEDDQTSWISLANFQRKHHEIMSANFNELLTESIEIGKITDPVDEPDFDKLSYDIYE
ncbi:hypothetical protein [Lactobacillus plantarum WCFS1] [Lactiplantibacillus mudanjiangensis]|uniref:hypothetical protein n=1 Tax=Lactiplantibacillus mudanjiangensis TaxID=1296538 RepID=UPI0010143101|nr:hypothetical protein [Lactobacillus plantarum WCFS1] [Lactiplantibacillus mudanjiangensis]